VGGQHQAPAALPPGKDHTSTHRKMLSGPQNRKGRFREEKLSVANENAHQTKTIVRQRLRLPPSVLHCPYREMGEQQNFVTKSITCNRRLITRGYAKTKPCARTPENTHLWRRWCWDC